LIANNRQISGSYSSCVNYVCVSAVARAMCYALLVPQNCIIRTAV